MDAHHSGRILEGDSPMPDIFLCLFYPQLVDVMHYGGLFFLFEKVAAVRLGQDVYKRQVLDSKNVSQTILSLTDETDDVRMQKKLEDALASARSANMAKSQFLSNMSHDIRTPMNAIVGMNAIAAANLQDQAKVKSCLEKITVSSKHLLSLINDVLDMSRIESGKIVLSEEDFGLSDLLHNLVTIVQPQACLLYTSLPLYGAEGLGCHDKAHHSAGPRQQRPSHGFCEI